MLLEPTKECNYTQTTLSLQHNVIVDDIYKQKHIFLLNIKLTHIYYGPSERPFDTYCITDETEDEMVAKHVTIRTDTEMSKFYDLKEQLGK